jgi:hypothetical protein
MPTPALTVRLFCEVSYGSPRGSVRQPPGRPGHEAPEREAAQTRAHGHGRRSVPASRIRAAKNLLHVEPSSEPGRGDLGHGRGTAPPWGTRRPKARCRARACSGSSRFDQVTAAAAASSTKCLPRLLNAQRHTAVAYARQHNLARPTPRRALNESCAYH